MKAIKIILAIIGLLILFVLVAPLFINGEYSVEKEVTINQSPEVVFDYVKYLKNQDEFSVWATMDPNMEKTFMGTDGTVGAISGWSSDIKDVGKGEQEIIGITEGERIDFELRFYEPFEATDNAYMEVVAVNDSVTLTKWGFYGTMKYPMNLMLLFMDMEEMLGGQLQEGLDNLKQLLDEMDC